MTDIGSHGREGASRHHFCFRSDSEQRHADCGQSFVATSGAKRRGAAAALTAGGFVVGRSGWPNHYLRARRW